MTSRASLILLVTATLAASGMAAAHGGPDRGQPWAGAPGMAVEEAGFLPVGEYRRHHRHHSYYRRDGYPYNYDRPYPQTGYAAPHWRPVPPGYYPYQPAYEPRPYYGPPPRHW